MSTSTAVKLGATALLILVIIAVVLQNREEATMQLLFATVAMPLAAILTIVFVLGFLLGLVTLFLLQRGSGDKKESPKRRDTEGPTSR